MCHIPERTTLDNYQKMNIEATHTRGEGQDSIMIGTSPAGSGIRLEALQWLPHPREGVFDFFSDAFQLGR